PRKGPFRQFGGGCEIRTHGRRKTSAVFKTAGLNHSPKPPGNRQDGGIGKALPCRQSPDDSTGAAAGPGDTNWLLLQLSTPSFSLMCCHFHQTRSSFPCKPTSG